MNKCTDYYEKPDEKCRLVPGKENVYNPCYGSLLCYANQPVAYCIYK